MSEQVKVPAIRFEGFGGEWRTFIFDELFPITSAARVHKHEWTESGVPFFRTSDVVAAYKGEGNAKAFISNKLYLELTAKIGRVRKGDLLVTGGGSIGTPYLVNSDDPLYFKDADLLWFKVRKSVNSYLLYTFFNTSIFRRYIKSISHIGTIAHYTVEQAKATPIALPIKDKEQQKIGGFFKQLDANLHHHQTKLDKLKTLKQAMLQKMFSQGDATEPEIRFKGFVSGWKKESLSQVALIAKGVALSRRDLIDGNYPVIAGGKTSPYKHNNYTHDKAITVSASGAYAGFIAFHPGKIWASDCSTIVPNKGNDILYLYYLLSGMQELIYSLQTGGAQPHVYPADLEGIRVRVPTDIREQRKIGNYFRKLDELIALERIQLDKLKQIKKACLTGMFV